MANTAKQNSGIVRKTKFVNVKSLSMQSRGKSPVVGHVFFSSSGNKPPLRTYAPLRRWDTMKKYEAPVVHCEYAVAAESLAQLLEEAFRLYLAHILALEKRPAVNCAR